MLHYFGTSLDDSGHYLWELEGNSISRGHRLRMESLPFNVEGLPYEYGKSYMPNGTVQHHQFCGFTILAIAGSCKDRRPGSKSIFFVKGNLTEEQMMDKIRLTPVAYEMIKRMPFEIKWNVSFASDQSTTALNTPAKAVSLHKL